MIVLFSLWFVADLGIVSIPVLSIRQIEQSQKEYVRWKSRDVPGVSITLLMKP